MSDLLGDIGLLVPDEPEVRQLAQAFLGLAQMERQFSERAALQREAAQVTTNRIASNTVGVGAGTRISMKGALEQVVELFRAPARFSPSALDVIASTAWSQPPTQSFRFPTEFLPPTGGRNWGPDGVIDPLSLYPRVQACSRPLKTAEAKQGLWVRVWVRVLVLTTKNCSSLPNSDGLA